MTIQETEPTATETPTAVGMVLELPLSVAVKSAAAMLTCTSRDRVTPVLTAANFSGTELLASDRHKAVRFPLPIASDVNGGRLVLGESFLIPQEALIWVSKLTLRSLEYGKAPELTVPDRGYTVRYERDAEAGTVTASVIDMFGVLERSEAFAEMTGNFPPIQNIYREMPPAGDEPHEFNPKFMGVILAYCDKHGDKGAPFAMTVHASERPGGTSTVAIQGAGASFLLSGYHEGRR